MSAAEDFGRELERRRKHLRWSRRTLEKRSGVSESYISRLEREFPTPGRYVIVDIAMAMERADGWTVDAALRLMGESPLTADERAVAVRSGKPAPDLASLSAYWQHMSDRDREILLHTASRFAGQSGSRGLTEPRVDSWDVDPEPAAPTPADGPPEI